MFYGCRLHFRALQMLNRKTIVAPIKLQVMISILNEIQRIFFSSNKSGHRFFDFHPNFSAAVFEENVEVLP